MDLNFSGPAFTWCNNQLGLARRWARLDRGLVNSSWLDKFSSYSLKHLPRLFSDHAPFYLMFLLILATLIRFSGLITSGLIMLDVMRQSGLLGPALLMVILCMLSLILFPVLGLTLFLGSDLAFALLILILNILKLAMHTWRLLIFSVPRFSMIFQVSKPASLQRLNSLKWA